MITATDIAPPGLSPALHAASFRERLLLIILFITVFASSVIEPSPHDVLVGVLAIAALIAGVRLERALVVPLMLLLIWNFAGMLALMHVPGEEKTIQYTATSVYLAITGLLFACLFAQNTMARLNAMRIAYVATAIIATFVGAAGYFDLFGTGHLFAPLGRALGAFKDPNVFGPFLIWPALFLLYRMIGSGVRFGDVLLAGILLFGLLLSFSRGAWFHFAISCVVMVALAFVAAPNARLRLRVLAVSASGIVVLSLVFLFLLSFDAIQGMFEERARLIQSYDVGQGGRFLLQELALTAVLNFPYGMGPFEFARVHGLQQHNMYLQAFLVYGWLGAMAYLLLLLSTLVVGLRNALVITPWQPYLITAVATFAGEMAEGVVIDTDHWRHFYLLLGMIWGLAAATLRQVRARPIHTPAGYLAAR
ncbi:MAG TPA: O-antigen ligase family protein [Pseudolabrys sp.]|nr:O-antigen ligase family protein [Pseudolabrys sp.]